MKMNFSENLSKFELDSKEYIFFEKVFEKLGPNFVRKSVEEKCREVHNNVNKAMQRYFKLHIFANAIIKSADQFEASEETSRLHDFNKPVSNAVHALYFNFVKKYMESERISQKPKLFGLTQESNFESSVKASEVEIVAFKKLVEDNIRDFCIQLIQCTGGTVLGEDWKKAFHRTIKDLESKATFLSSDEIMEQSNKQMEEMIKTYHEELNKEVMLLNKLLSLYEQKLEFESGLAKFYLQRCYAVSQKIKVLEMKILTATYNEETIPALNKISDQLDQSEQKMKEEHNEKTVALQQYLKLGKEYERFVDEFALLTKSIREQQWSIDELKKRSSQYGASGNY